MKKLLIIFMFVPFASFGQQAQGQAQAQSQSTNVSIKTTNVELAEKMEASLTITKPMSFDLESVKGFVLI